MKKNFDWMKNSDSIIPKSKKKHNWFVEWLGDNEFHGYGVNKIIATKKSPYQKALLAEFDFYGKVLIIDGEIQSAEIDEFFYHEALIHPALLMHPNPQTALIIGAGEGATARELLKSKTIKKIVAVDIDKGIVDFAKKYMYSWHKGSFGSKKVELIIGDAKRYVYNTNLRFDIVISDLPCPISDGPACKLYTLDFYKKLISVMTKNGILAVQAGPMLACKFGFHKMVYSSLRKIFKTTCPYCANVPSFNMPWSFVYASKTKADPLLKKAGFFDKVINDTVKGRLKTIDGLTIKGMFGISKYYRSRLAEKKLSRTKNSKTFKIVSVY
jgi:spermidine synthase